MLPIILAVTLSGPKQAEAKTDDVLSQDAQVSFSEPSDDQPTVTVTPTITPSPTPEPTPVLLANGDENPTVIDIQLRLIELGYLDFCETTEHFGSATEAAVKLFQRQLGEEQTGIVDDDTYNRMMSPDAEDYILYLEAEGEDVRAVQDRLYQMGYISEKSHTTGYFGEITEQAVKDFQENNGISADGKVGTHHF